jgi:hypothetical protein
MPNKNTFTIKPINRLVLRLTKTHKVSVDPFSNGYHYATITNDLDPDKPASYHLDAAEFLEQIGDRSCGLVLLDPPYSPRQVSEYYRKMSKSVNMQTTQSSYWTKLKKEIARIIEPGGHVLTCGWNSGGIGKGLGFKIEEILLVPHGSWHNDTICTVEAKSMAEQ